MQADVALQPLQLEFGNDDVDAPMVERRNSKGEAKEGVECGPGYDVYFHPPTGVAASEEASNSASRNEEKVQRDRLSGTDRMRSKVVDEGRSRDTNSV